MEGAKLLGCNIKLPIGVNLVIHILVGWVEPQVKPNILRLSKRFMLGFVPQPNLQEG